MYCKDSHMIFATKHINYSLDGYKVKAIHYVLKNTPNFKVLESDYVVYTLYGTVLSVPRSRFRHARERYAFYKGEM